MVIKKLENFSSRSFHNYTGPDDGVEFGLVNILYGKNGSGKSTLAKHLASRYANDDPNHEESSYRLFDSDYVKNNILLEDEGQIKGVKAFFGQENIMLKKQMTQIQSRLASCREEKDSLAQEIADKEKEIKDIENNVYDRRKGNVTIRAKNGTFKTKKSFYEKDLLEATKLIGSDKLKSYRSDYSERSLNRLQDFRIINIDNLPDEDELRSINKILETSYSREEIKNAHILKWVNEGIALHDGQHTKQCQFCGADLYDLGAIKQKASRAAESDIESKENMLKATQSKITQLNARIPEIKNNQNTAVELLGSSVENDYTTICDGVMTLKTLNKLIDQKLGDMSASLSYEIDGSRGLIQVIQNAISSLESIQRRYNAELSQLTKQKENVNILIKGAIAQEILENQAIVNLADAIEEDEKHLAETDREIKKLESEYEELKQSRAETGAFAQHVSNFLGKLEIGFRLNVTDSGNYVIEHGTEETELKVSDISEGERNLLAFLYFIFEMREDLQQSKIKHNIELIIIDDPISSVDFDNRTVILSLLREVLKDSKSQVFLFTHSYVDFRSFQLQLRFQNGPKNGPSSRYNYFLIDKINAHSRVRRPSLKDDPYVLGFQEVFRFSQINDPSKITEKDIIHIPNLMRKVLEQRLNDTIRRSTLNLGNIKKAFSIEPKDHTYDDDIEHLCTLCNLYSHEATPDESSILKSAKFMMETLLKRYDKAHFMEMVGR